MKHPRAVFGAGLLAVAIGAAVIASPMIRPRCTEISGRDTLVVPLSKLGRDAISFFCYRDSAGERLRFLLARDSGGTVYSVFDACRQCYKFHRGYTVSDGYLICRLCGNRYKISDMQKGRASCVPVKLPVDLHNGKIQIKVADLKNGNSLF